MNPFFADVTAYRTWIASMPGIFPCNQEPIQNKQDDPREPWAPTTEGPFYFSSQFLLLRVGAGGEARYCAIKRVASEGEADFYWYVPASFSEQGGERMYAAYVWDMRPTPHHVVDGDTLRKARAALSTYLSSPEGVMV